MSETKKGLKDYLNNIRKLAQSGAITRILVLVGVIFMEIDLMF